MEVKEKTDICVSVIQNAIATLNNLSIIANLSDNEIEEIRSLLSDIQDPNDPGCYIEKPKRLEYLFPKRLLIQKLTRLKALFYYRILPVYNYDTMFRDEDEVYSDLCMNDLYTGGDHYKEVLSILQEETISLKDLENELWIICPDIENIDKYLDVTRMKFRQIISSLPVLSTFTQEYLFCTPNKYRDTFNKLSEIGAITDDEVKLIFLSSISIARSISSNMDLITSMYNKLKCMNIDNVIEDNNPTSLPAELSSNKATDIFKKAIENGFCTTKDNGYDWNFGKFTGQLLAYFCQVLSFHLNLSKRTDRYGNKTVSWKPFEIAFKVKNIKSYKNDWMKYNTKFTPTGYELIDKIFEN